MHIKKLFPKMTALLLSVCLLLGTAPTQAFAEVGSDGNDGFVLDINGEYRSFLNSGDFKESDLLPNEGIKPEAGVESEQESVALPKLSRALFGVPSELSLMEFAPDQGISEPRDETSELSKDYKAGPEEEDEDITGGEAFSIDSIDNIIWSEDFDGSSYKMESYRYEEFYGNVAPCWFVAKPTGDPYAQSGEFIAVFNSYNTWSENQAFLESKEMITSISSNDINVSFYMYHDDTNSQNWDLIAPYYVDDDNDAYWFADTVEEAIVYRYSQTPGWRKYTLTIPEDMSPGKRFYIGFIGLSDYGQNIYIDSITVTQEPDSGSVINKPTVTAQNAAGVTSSSAVLHGDITANGGGAIEEYGFYYGTSALNMTKVTVGTGDKTGAFTYGLTGLSPSTSYIYRAYAKNSAGESVSSDITFSTNAAPAVDVLWSEDFDGSSYKVDNYLPMSYVGVTAPEWTWIHEDMYGAIAAHSGEAMSVFNSSYTYAGNYALLRSTELIAPISGNDITIEFFMYHDSLYQTYKDKVQVVTMDEHMSILPDMDDSEIFRYSTEEGWVKHTVTYRDPAPGVSFYLGFIGVSGWGQNIYIDTITVTQEPDSGTGGVIGVTDVTDVTITPKPVNLNVGQTLQLSANISPSDAANKNVSWKSGSRDIADISETGFVTAYKSGSATITVTTEDGGKTDTCVVTVSDITETGTVITTGAPYTGDYIVAFNSSTDITNSQSTGSLPSAETVNAEEAQEAEFQDVPEYTKAIYKRDGVTLYELDPDEFLPTVPMPDLESLSESSGLESKYSQAQPRISVGETRVLPSSDQDSNKIEINTTYLYSGEHCDVYVETAQMNRIGAAEARAVGEEFDNNIYDRMVDSFGDYLTGYSGGKGFKDGKLIIMLEDIRDSYSSNSSYIAGFFSSSNLIIDGLAIVHIDIYPLMHVGAGSFSVYDGYSTLVHELQHLINYSHFVMNYIDGKTPASDTNELWWNEAFSIAAQHMMGYKRGGLYITESRIRDFNGDSGSVVKNGAILNYKNYADNNQSIAANYGMTMLFGQYLRTQTKHLPDGGDRIFKSIISSYKGNYLAITEGLAAVGYPVTDFAALNRNFRIALVQKDDTGPYGFMGESAFDAVNMPLHTGSGSISLKGGAAIVRRLSGSYTPVGVGSNIKFAGFGTGSVTKYPVNVNNGSGGGSYAQGEAVTITADPAPGGQRFKQWSISPSVTFTGGTNAQAPKAIFIMPNKSVIATAVYEDVSGEKFNVNVTGGSGGGSYAQGEAVTITADPAPDGQRFKQWNISPAVTFTGGTNAQASRAIFIMPNKSVTATAVYVDIYGEQFDVNVTGGSGGGSYAQGETVTITADSAPEGQRFRQWNISPAVTFTDGTNALSPEAKFIMPEQNVTAVAAYEDLHVVTYTVTANGVNVGEYAAGITVKLTADPAASGKRFKEWKISPVVTFREGTNKNSEAAEFIMPARNVTANAVYENIARNRFALNVNNGTGGGNFAKDKAVTITANPAPAGRVFKEWNIEPDVSNELFTENTNKNNLILKFKMPDHAVTATAVYDIAPEYVKVSSTTADGAYIDLTNEDVELFGFHVAAYSVNGGNKWIKGALPREAGFNKLFDKALTLWVVNAIDNKGRPSPDAERIEFPPINKRPVTNSEKLAPFYDEETWDLKTRVKVGSGLNAIPKGSYPTNSYEFALADSKGKQVEQWDLLKFSFDVMSGRNRPVYLFRTPALDEEGNGGYTPASKIFRVTPLNYAAAPKYKFSNSGILSLKKGDMLEMNGGPPGKLDKAVKLNLNSQPRGVWSNPIKVWKSGTETKPRSDIQENVPLPNKFLWRRTLFIENNGILDKRYGYYNENVIPEIEFGLIDNTQTAACYALLMYDTTAPGNGFVHWAVTNVVFVGNNATSYQHLHDFIGNNGERYYGYAGPAPPRGTHKYVFVIYALKEKVYETGRKNFGVHAGSRSHSKTKANFEKHLGGKSNIIAQTSITMKYKAD